eukprot:jgi/Bigna1/90167/estExt_fgenesh1_pg.C_640032
MSPEPGMKAFSIILGLLVFQADSLHNENSLGGKTLVAGKDARTPECGADKKCLFSENRHICAHVFYTADKESTLMKKDFFEATGQENLRRAWLERSKNNTNSPWCISLPEAYKYMCQDDFEKMPCDCKFYDCKGTDTCDFASYNMKNEAAPFSSTYVQDCFKKCCKEDVAACNANRAARRVAVLPTGFPTPAPVPTPHPSKSPSEYPTPHPSPKPTPFPSRDPSSQPTEFPTADPSSFPTPLPTPQPTDNPTQKPSSFPSPSPTKEPSAFPTAHPTQHPVPPVADPTPAPTGFPTQEPTNFPSPQPTNFPTEFPTPEPTVDPTGYPTPRPSAFPTPAPTGFPTAEPTMDPTQDPTKEPTIAPTQRPTGYPTTEPTNEPTPYPTREPTPFPTAIPTTKEGYVNVKDFTLGKLLVPEKGLLLGKIDTSQEFTLSFDIIPTQSFPLPLPLSLHRFARMDTNTEADRGCTSANPLPLFVKSHVKMTVQEGIMIKLFVDGKEACRFNPRSHQLLFAKKGVKVYLGDKFYSPAQAQVSNISYSSHPNLPLIPHGISLADKMVPIRKGELLGYMDTTSSFKLSFDVQIDSIVDSGFASILHLTLGVDNGALGSRIPGVWLKPGTTQLYIRSGTTMEHDVGCDIHANHALELGKKHTIVFIVTEGPTHVVKIDGSKVCHFNPKSNDLVPNSPATQLWVGDKWYTSAVGKIGSIIYEPLPLMPRPSPSDLTSGKTLVLGGDPIYLGYLDTFETYEMTTHVKLTGIVRGWSNLLHVTAKGTNFEKPGSRIPGIWVIPHSTRLQVIMGSKNMINNGCATKALPINKTVAITMRAYPGPVYTVHFDDEQQCAITPKCQLFPAHNNSRVWVADKWHHASKAEVVLMKYGPAPVLNKNSIISSARKLQRGYFVGVINTTKEFHMSFKLTPRGKVKGWSNIIHLTERNNKGLKSRLPAVFFQPDKLRLTLVVTDKNGKQLRKDSKFNLKKDQTYLVDIVVGKLGLAMRLDKKYIIAKHKAFNRVPATKNIKIWASNPFAGAANAEISDLTYTREIKPEDLTGEDLTGSNKKK